MAANIQRPWLTIDIGLVAEQTCSMVLEHAIMLSGEHRGCLMPGTPKDHHYLSQFRLTKEQTFFLDDLRTRLRRKNVALSDLNRSHLAQLSIDLLEVVISRHDCASDCDSPADFQRRMLDWLKTQVRHRA
jgi:hypothetical protein